MSPVPPVGLYSIGVRGLSVPELLRWAARHRIPYLHLRGGARGHRLAEQQPATLREWARLAAGTVPVTAVTSDVELTDLLAGDRAAHDELARLAEAAAVLGATTLRVFGRTEPPETLRPDRLPALDATLAVELHAAAWFDAGLRPALGELLAATPRLRLLTDSHQLQRYAHGATDADADWLVQHSRLVHFCDPGDGLAGTAHARVAAAVARAATSGHRPELGFEWIGDDRSPEGCLARYLAAVDWWRRSW